VKETVLHFFYEYPHLALFISLFLSIVVAVLAVVPSFFITAANILFFGFWPGTLISFLGEALGAVLSFLLYRNGFKEKVSGRLYRFPRIQKLVEQEGKQAFLMIFSLRLLPFVPSGLVTFAAAIGKVSTLIFLVASSLGKIPALLIEAYSVYQVTRFGWQGKIITITIALVLLYIAFSTLASRRKES
jgi:uncharacterized membrane protein YdjX (TVP38/TMEM64 family)